MTFENFRSSVAYVEKHKTKKKTCDELEVFLKFKILAMQSNLKKM